ncbi:GNAT family N-acetyltransferase [Natronoglycomyces albus]|uniref:GNAT family N-acetyltransferase n=2 Tax=Natronoglycomyces albus TaxID=2811108 RepID=A0A895XUQ3_9ACTN|nr:GNAT family N-acetyltransferase [Natronoglycomyces albus]
MDTALSVEEIGPDNVEAALAIKVRPEQEGVVASVAHSLAEAYANQSSAWPRLIFDGDKAVAFLMGGFDPDNPMELFRCGIWRLNVAADAQGKGYGRFAVEVLIEEAKRRGFSKLTTMWVPGDVGPEKFYVRMGFTVTGEIFGGQVVGELPLK